MDDEENTDGFPGSKPLDDGIDKSEWPWNAFSMGAAYAKMNHRRRMKGLYPMGTGRRPKDEEPTAPDSESEQDQT